MGTTENSRSQDATRRHVLMMGAFALPVAASARVAHAGTPVGSGDKAMAGAAARGCNRDGAAGDWVRGVPTDAPFSSGASPPFTAAPAGAVDTHHHIFSNAFLTTSGTPLEISADVDDYRAFKRRLGLSRSIVVAASPYGTDNSIVVDALDRLGSDAARGVALVDPDVSDAELDRLGRYGVRGLRIYLAKNRVPTPAELRQLARRAADRNWLLQFVGNREREVIAEWTDVLVDLPCRMIIDHLGWAPQPAGCTSATATAIRRLVDGGRAYIKLSGLYLSSRSGPPEYSDVDDLAAAFVKQAPDRVLWGSDWPHPVALPYVPDDALMFDKLTVWAPDAAVRQKILVTNPEQLFWTD
ncbi:amidohydrolase family protein [Blastomonas sp.]|uniref:amidohydrolase family protein n=1 Tax=Blastomonas sp. TaxID=1909299 RepID=UPI00406A695E